MAVYRIMRWSEFRGLVRRFMPKIIFYAKESNPLAKPKIGLKLIFYYGMDTYVFTDYADGKALHKTGIPVGASGDEGRIDDEDIRRFLMEHLGDVKVVSLGFLSID